MYCTLQVDIEINGEPADLHMKLGEAGEAFFVQEAEDAAEVRCMDCGHYQRVSIASYASAGIARAEMSICPSVRLCLSVLRHTPVLYQNEES